MYYYFPQPPVFLLIFGLFTGVTCGLAFEATLKQKVNAWSTNQSRHKLKESRTFNLFLPFLGICLGSCLFLASGFETFVLDRWFAYAMAIPLTLFVAGLVWSQLGEVLQQLEQGGSKALDLDSFE
jgi:hypothetical protein